MENRIHMVIELDDGKKYIVVNQAIYKNDSYLLVNEVDEDETTLKEEVLILKEVQEDNNSIVETVTDPDLLELLAKYLAPKE